MMSTQEIARQSAAAAVRILDGEPSANIKNAGIGSKRAEVRLARIAALEDQRGATSAGQRRAVSPADDLAELSLADPASDSRDPGPGRHDRGAALRAPAPPRRGGCARTSMSELMHMNRIATAGELSASIAHEVNQPLTGISARASAARAGWPRSRPISKKCATCCARSSTQAIARPRSWAAFGRCSRRIRGRGPGRYQQADPATSWRSCGSSCQKNGVELQTALDEGLPPVECDAVQLQQVILNLVMNAIEAMQTTEPRSCASSRSRSRRTPSACWFRIPAKASIRCISIASSGRWSRPRSAAWGWVFPSAARSSKATTDASGSRRRLRTARSFSSNCRPKRTRNQGRLRAALPSTGSPASAPAPRRLRASRRSRRAPRPSSASCRCRA